MRMKIIRSLTEVDEETGKPLYWSNEDGWVDKLSATMFDHEQAERVRLPAGGAVWDDYIVGPGVSIARRPQSPHEALKLMDTNGDSYYFSFNNGTFDVLSHGPEWVLIRKTDAPDAPAHWRRWDKIEGLFIIEGDYDPLEAGVF